MEYLKEYLKNPFLLLIVIGALLFINVGTFCYFLCFQEKEECVCAECLKMEEVSIPEEEEYKEIKVDIKGYVKNPGVYVLTEGAIINDLLTLAGGIKSGGTTENINLSQKLQNEDSIVVLSKSELKKLMTVADVTALEVVSPEMPDTVYHANASSNSSITTTNSSASKDSEKNTGTSEIGNTSKKVSINTATKEELMTLDGIGESKAIKIIEYRETKKFTDITELMNVSGIGESVYEKIKDRITL